MDTQVFDKIDDINDDKVISQDSVPDFDTVNSDDEPVDREISEEEASVKKNKRKNNTRKKDAPSMFVAGLFDWTSAFLFALIAVVLIMTFCFRIVDVDGGSMLNTLQDHNKVIVTGLDYKPQVGDIVVISHGVELEKVIVKRIIAVGGQTVDLDSRTGNVIVDGVVIEENYVTSKTEARDTPFPLEVEEGKVFVLGDNRSVSKDSRYQEVGLIDEDWIIGKVQYRFYPFDEIGKVE